jgi:hypothetical protein
VLFVGGCHMHQQQAIAPAIGLLLILQRSKHPVGNTLLDTCCRSPLLHCSHCALHCTAVFCNVPNTHSTKPSAATHHSCLAVLQTEKLFCHMTGYSYCWSTVLLLVLRLYFTPGRPLTPPALLCCCRWLSPAAISRGSTSPSAASS